MKSLKKLIVNSGWYSGGFLVITIIALLTTPLLVWKLGIEGYGIYILINSLVGYYGILDLGLGQGLIKFVAEYNAKNEQENISNAINAAIVVQMFMGLIASLLLIIFASSIVDVLKISNAYKTESKYYIYLCSFGFFFTMINGAFSSALMGLQRYDITSKMDVMINTGINILFAALLLVGFGLREGILLNVGITLLSFFIYLFIVKKKIPAWKFNPYIKLSFLKSLLNFSFFVFLTRVSGLFSNYIVRFVVSFFLGPAGVTFYVIPSKLVGAIGSVFGSAVNVIFPYTSHLNATNEEEKIKRTVLIGSKIFASLGVPIMIFVFLFCKPILQIWMGNNFADAAWFVLGILAISSLIGSFSALPNLVIMGKGNSKLVGTFALISVVLYTILLPIFTKYWGVNGTAMGMLITNILTIAFVVYKTTNYLKLEIKNYLKIVFQPHLVFGVIALIAFISGVFRYKFNPYLYLLIGLILMTLQLLYLIRNNSLPLKEMWKKVK